MEESTQRGPFQCPICYDTINEPAMLKSCDHTFCKSCIEKWIGAQQKDHTCPLCRQKIQQSSGSQELNLAALKEQLAEKTKELKAQEEDDRTSEEEECIEVELAKKELEEAGVQLGQLEEQFSGIENEFEQLHEDMPSASFFDNIYAEVFKDPQIMDTTEQYEDDDVNAAWDNVRALSDLRHELNSKLEETKEQIQRYQQDNSKMRRVCSGFEPEEYVSRIEWESFKRLSEAMGWEYSHYLHLSKHLSKFNFPPGSVPKSTYVSKNNSRMVSSLSASKRSAGVSSFSQTKRPNKVSKTIIGRNLLDDVIELD